jgi:hypothetical protein
LLEKISRYLRTDLDDFIIRGQIFQLKRYLIAEKDDIKANEIASAMAEYFRTKLLEGVVKT